MRLSTLLQNNKNSKWMTFTVLILIIALSACNLDGNDVQNVTQESEVKNRITIKVSNYVFSGSRVVERTDIESVSLTVRRKDNLEILNIDSSNEYSADETFTFSADLAVNTDLTVEVFGKDSEGELVAYGSQNLIVSENEQRTSLIPMVLYYPSTLPIVKMTINKPSSVYKDGTITLIASGYVLDDEWPIDPSGNKLDALTLSMSAVLNGGETIYFDDESLKYEDLDSTTDPSNPRVSFSNISLILKADDSEQAIINLSAELTPGFTYVYNTTITQIEKPPSFSYTLSNSIKGSGILINDGAMSNSSDDQIKYVEISEVDNNTISISIQWYPCNSGSYTASYGVCLKAYHYDGVTWRTILDEVLSGLTLNSDRISTFNYEIPTNSAKSTNYIRASIMDRNNSSMLTIPGHYGSNFSGCHYDNADVSFIVN